MCPQKWFCLFALLFFIVGCDDSTSTFHNDIDLIDDNEVSDIDFLPVENDVEEIEDDLILDEDSADLEELDEDYNDAEDISDDDFIDEDAVDEDITLLSGILDFEKKCSDELSLKVTLYTNSIARFHHIYNNVAHPERGWMFDVSAMEGASDVYQKEEDGKLVIVTPEMTVTVSDECMISIKDSLENELFSQKSTVSKDNQGVISSTILLKNYEYIYGLGEKGGVADRRGRTFTNWTSDAMAIDPTGRYRSTTDPLYQTHPYYLSMTSGVPYGFYLANSFKTVFDIGESVSDELKITADGGDFDFFFIQAEKPVDVVKRYSKIVGKTKLPPKWALGFHQCRWGYTPYQKVEEVADELRKRDLPADGIWLDIDYMDGYRSFTWNPDTFSDHEGMLTRLKQNGFKTTSIIDPGIKYDTDKNYFAYADGVADNHFIKDLEGNLVVREVWPGDAVFPDFTNPLTRSWWGTLVSDLLDSGLEGIWIDMNEPAIFTENTNPFPLDVTVNGDGTETEFKEVKNVYALNMAKATFEGYKSKFPEKRPFILTRSGFSGSQKYAAMWTGDAETTWEHLDTAVSMLQGLAVSGYEFTGSDVGGFWHGTDENGDTYWTTPELYTRWMVLGAFSAFFRSHVGTDAPAQEPYAFGPEVEEASRRAIELRYQLIPYFYNVFHDVSDTGTPFINPLWMQFPEDETAHSYEKEFFVGNSLLVAPVVTEGAMNKTIYFPEELFYDYFTGAAFKGPKTESFFVPGGAIPLFVKAGSIFPTQDAGRYTDDPLTSKTVYIEVYPGLTGKDGSFTLYEDDDKTTAYQNGVFKKTLITSKAESDKVTVNIAASEGSYSGTYNSMKVRIHGVPAKPSKVLVDGNSVTVNYDASKRMVSADVTKDGNTHVLEYFYDTSVKPERRDVTVNFTIDIPDTTDSGETIYLATNRTWLANEVALTTFNDSGNLKATGTVTVKEGELIKFKVTRGLWDKSETGTICQNALNTWVDVSWGTDGTMTVSHTVYNWSDSCVSQPRDINVEIIAYLPDNTPAGDIYIASSAVSDWSATGTLMTRDGNTARGSLNIAEGDVFNYKITRGSWETVEKNGYCTDISNRGGVAQWDYDGKQRIRIWVMSWNDTCN